jgi:hypothetical protein
MTTEELQLIKDLIEGIRNLHSLLEDTRSFNIKLQEDIIELTRRINELDERL